MIANEQWKRVDGFTRYEVSNTGKVRNIHTKRDKALRLTKNGYLITDLKENGKQKTCYVHRLVAEAFVENAFSFDTVNHKDEDKLNNAADNLEWCTMAYNNRYGTHNERIKSTKRERYGKRLAQIDCETGKIVRSYKSFGEAAEAVGVTRQAIHWALLADNHTACGYRWVVVE